MNEQPDYRAEGIHLLAQHEGHFWFRHRNRVIQRALKLHTRKNKAEISILEIGAGAGAISRFLKKQGYRVAASDMFEAGIAYLKKSVDSCFVFNVIDDPIPTELQQQFDVLILGDLIEHLDEPVCVLRRIQPFLKKEGMILITVPALMQLWSVYDEACGHKKRYTKKELAEVAKAAGYTVRDQRYFMFVPSIVLFFLRRIRSWKKMGASELMAQEMRIPHLLNIILSGLMSAEFLLGTMLPLPWGSSALVVAETIT